MRFDKVKFPIFMHVKPPDDESLATLIPTVWWKLEKKVNNSLFRSSCKGYYDRYVITIRILVQCLVPWKVQSAKDGILYVVLLETGHGGGRGGGYIIWCGSDRIIRGTREKRQVSERLSGFASQGRR